MSAEQKPDKLEEWRKIADQYGFLSEPMAAAIYAACNRVEDLKAEIRELKLTVIDKRNAEVDRMYEDV